MADDDDSSDDDVVQKQEEVIEEVKSSSHVLFDPKVGPVAFRMRPSLENVFKAKIIKGIIQQTLVRTLQGRKYNSEDARNWTTNIADSVNLAVKEMKMPRFKHVVQVTLGQQLGSGCRYISRCSWDTDCDSQTSDVFSNTTMFCVCTVFGIYVY